MPRSLRALPVAAFLVASSLSGVQACATGHIAATLTSFPKEAISTPFYWAPEAGGQIQFVLRAIGDDCTPQPVSIRYATKDGSATAPFDYAPASGERVVSTDPAHGDQDRQPVPVSVVDDLVPEGAVENAVVELTGVTGGYLTPPTSASLVIVDDDGPDARVALDAAASYRQLETFSKAGVAVFRGGSAAGTTTVHYSVSPGPAPAADPDADYKAESGSLTFGPGDRIEMVPITLVNDSNTESNENFTVALGNVDGGVIDGSSSATFTILDNEELGVPLSKFHHPRQGWKYKPSDYRIREIHVFTEDRGGSGVAKAEFALRKNLTGGGCAWLSKRKWKNAPCKKEVWNKMGMYETDFFYIRVPELEASNGTIQTYSAFSRAIDGAGNKEKQLEKGRNANTFDIK